MAIELNVTHGEQKAHYRRRSSVAFASTGQPEDNLDNAFIAERIVAELRRAKLSRQFLFATHNANIPVFGDAERIGVLSVGDGKGVISSEQQGAIDVPAVQGLAADILKGGKSAINQPREKYGFN